MEPHCCYWLMSTCHYGSRFTAAGVRFPDIRSSSLSKIFFCLSVGPWLDLEHLGHSKLHISIFSFLFFCVLTEDYERADTFEGLRNMGEELESLRATIEERHVRANESARPPHRHKRFLSYPRYVELMVTADAKMTRHHGPNLEHYILTIMSVVSKIMFLNIFNLFISCLVTRQGPQVAHEVRLEGGVVCLRSTGVFSFREAALFSSAQFTMATYAELLTC